jgi:tetratricopeptide (TPR) repeat protein
MRKILLIVFIMSDLVVNAQPTGDQLIDAYGNYYKKSYAEAIAAFTELINSNQPARTEWYLYKGIAEFKSGEYKSAKIDLKTATSDKLSEAYLWYARVQAFSGENKEAFSSLTHYLKESQLADADLIKQDTLFRSMHNTPEWFALWQDDWQTEAEKIYNDAAYYYNKRLFDKAHSVIESGIDAGFNEAMLFELNSSVYDAEGNLQLALNEINRAIETDQESKALQMRKAQLLIKMNKYTDAVAILSDILNRYPEAFDARLLRSAAALKSGNTQIAKTDIDLYLKYLNTGDAQFLAGEIYFKSGEYLNALRFINPLLEKDQSKADYFKLRGMIYYETQTYTQAAYDLSMSLDLLPDDGECNYFLGLTENKLGNVKLACYYMKRAKRDGELRAVNFLQANCEK